jgi:hypothetical protein
LLSIIKQKNTLCRGHVFLSLCDFISAPELFDRFYFLNNARETSTKNCWSTPVIVTIGQNPPISVHILSTSSLLSEYF